LIALIATIGYFDPPIRSGCLRQAANSLADFRDESLPKTSARFGELISVPGVIALCSGNGNQEALGEVLLGHFKSVGA